MKKIKIRILVTGAVFFTFLLPLALLPTSCTTPTQQKVTYDTLYSLGHTVNSGFAAYCDLLLAGKVSTNSVPQVAAAFNAFQLSYGAAVEFARGNSNAPPSADLTAKGFAVITAIQQAKGGQ